MLAKLPGRHDLTSVATERLCQDLGDFKAPTWSFCRKAVEGVIARAVTASVLLDCFRQATGPQTRDRGRVFVVAWKREGRVTRPALLYPVLCVGHGNPVSMPGGTCLVSDVWFPGNHPIRAPLFCGFAFRNRTRLPCRWNRWFPGNQPADRGGKDPNHGGTMSASVVALLNQKGGVGKTSTCHHLAGAFAAAGLRSSCLSTDDPQASLSQGFFGPAADRRIQPCRHRRRAVRGGHPFSRRRLSGPPA